MGRRSPGVYKDKKGYYIRAYIHGREVKRRGFKTHEEAKLARDKILKEARGNEYGLVMIEHITFSDFIPIYLEHARAHKAASTVRRETKVINLHMFPRWRTLTLNRITMRLISDYHISRSKQVKNRTANYEIAVLSAILRLAIERGHLAAIPWKKMPKLPEDDSARREALSFDEVARILESASRARHKRTHLFVTLLVYTGMRHDEALKLRWEDIDLEAGEIKIMAKTYTVNDEKIRWKPKSKNSVRNIPTKEELHSVLEQYAGEGWLFPGRNNREVPAMSFKKAFAKVVERAELPAHITPHNLRHTWGSMALMAGMSPQRVAEIMGDRLETVVRVYAHCIKGTAKAEMELLPSFEAGTVIPFKGNATVPNTVPAKK